MAQKIEERREGVDIQVYLAAERTLLSWIRTGLAMVGFGFVVARFGLFLHEAAVIQGVELQHPPHISVWLGTGMAATGVLVVLIAGIQHAQAIRRMRRGEAMKVPTQSPSFLLSLILALLGIALVAYLVVISLGTESNTLTGPRNAPADSRPSPSEP